MRGGDVGHLPRLVEPAKAGIPERAKAGAPDGQRVAWDAGFRWHDKQA
jgi:hypothetical protein